MPMDASSEVTDCLFISQLMTLSFSGGVSIKTAALPADLWRLIKTRLLIFPPARRVLIYAHFHGSRVLIGDGYQ